jgi:predicted Ser/Thr protein kinase
MYEMIKEILPWPYDVFEPIVADIKAGTSSAEFLGSGSESSVWRATIEGSDYAIKFAREYSPRGRRRDTRKAVEGNVAAGLRGLGILGLEQLRTASPEDGVTIYDYASGTKIAEMTDEAIKAIAPAHVTALAETVAAATKAGIELDGWNDEGGNAFFCPLKGFTLIDYWSTENISLEDNKKYAMRSLGRVGVEL